MTATELKTTAAGYTIETKVRSADELVQRITTPDGAKMFPDTDGYEPADLIDLHFEGIEEAMEHALSAFRKAWKAVCQ